MKNHSFGIFNDVYSLEELDFSILSNVKSVSSLSETDFTLHLKKDQLSLHSRELNVSISSDFMKNKAQKRYHVAQMAVFG